MIVIQNVTINNTPFTYTYSNAGRYVVRDGISYEQAYDPAQFGRTYTQGDLIQTVGESADDDYATAGRILMGVQE